MTIELSGIVVRNERRLRLAFSSALAAGAFGSPAPAAYVVDNLDGKGVSPGVAAAIIVAGSTANAEIALDSDLVPGAFYRVTTIGIPGADASTCTAASDQQFRVGDDQRQTNAEPKALDADLLLFQRDIVHTGTDYLETAEGDLATVGGIDNAQAALRRRLLGSPLPWDPSYSPRARQYVDGPVTGIGGLRGVLQQQALADDRIASVDVTLVIDPDNAADSAFTISPTYVGGRNAGTDSLDVPVT